MSSATILLSALRVKKLPIYESTLCQMEIWMAQIDQYILEV